MWKAVDEEEEGGGVAHGPTELCEAYMWRYEEELVGRAVEVRWERMKKEEQTVAGYKSKTSRIIPDVEQRRRLSGSGQINMMRGPRKTSCGLLGPS